MLELKLIDLELHLVELTGLVSQQVPMLVVVTEEYYCLRMEQKVITLVVVLVV
jgi:hypothetical protein